MIQDVLSSIAKALYEEFGDNYDIYTEEVTQGTQTPCFLVEHIHTTYTPSIGVEGMQYKYDSRYSVKYLASVPNTRQEGYGIMGRVFECLYTFGTTNYGKARTSNRNMSMQVDVLTYTFRLVGLLKEELNPTLMQTQEYAQEVKEND